MKSKWFSRAAVALLFLLGTSGLAEATSITWNLTGPGSEGAIGNQRTFTAGGITVTATAWSYNTSFQQAALGQWSTGLGVCNTSETCSSPYHQVDNYGQDDYVLFLFSAPVDPLTVRIDPYGTYDRDVSYWTGNVDLPLDLIAGESYASLAALGFGSRIDNDSFSSSSYRDVSIVSPFVNALLFGSRLGGDSYADYFKITSMSASVSVPEPTSLLLLGAGLAVIGIWNWRRKSV